MGCVFCKIRDRIIPKEFTFEDEDVMVFPDIHPLKSIHLLIVPKMHMEDLLALNNKELTVKLTKTIQEMIKKRKLESRGYRIAVNGGGAQIISHLHFHLMGPLGKTAIM